MLLYNWRDSMEEENELFEEDLENVVGIPLPGNKVPSKFKEIKNKSQEKRMEAEKELNNSQLFKTYGGPIREENLPDEYKIGR